MSTWDVFVSYTHADMEAASRIQAFIEDYPLPGGRSAVRVFRDKTDLAAGDLGRSIPREIDSARVLMLCCSPAAAQSGWVAREVDAFDAAHGGQAPIVPLLLAGTPETSVPPALRDRDALILDLRAGWRFGRPRTTTRVELLRALASAADTPLRELIPWDVARRRRRAAWLGGGVAVAVAAISIASTSAWMTRLEAEDAALKRESEVAVLRIESGDVAEGMAMLGHALRRDNRRVLNDGLDVFRHWLGAFPPASESAGSAQGLLRIGGRVYARARSGSLLPLDFPEPFTAVAPWDGRIVAAGPGGAAVFDADSGTKLAEAVFPPGTEVLAIRWTRDRSALAILARMIEVQNDEDKDNVPVPCTALLLRTGGESVQGKGPVSVQLVTEQREETRPMHGIAGGHLFGHDCIPPSQDNADPTAKKDTVESSPLRLPFAVPRLPTGEEILDVSGKNWDESLENAWPKAVALQMTALPALRPERALWAHRGEAPHAPAERYGFARGLDDAAISALGLEDVEGGSRLPADVVELAGFMHDGGRVIWGIDVCGNSILCVGRCVAPAAGKVSSCEWGAALSAIKTWRVVTSDGRRFAHVSNHLAEPRLTIFDVADYAKRLPNRQPPAGVIAATFTTEGKHLAVLTATDELVVYDVADQVPRHARSIRLGAGDSAQHCAGHGSIAAVKGTHVAVLSDDCTLRLVDVATGNPMWRTRLAIKTTPDTDREIAVTRDGSTLVVLAGGTVRLIHPATGAALSPAIDVAEFAGMKAAAGDTSKQEVSATERHRGRIVTYAAQGAAIEIGGQLFVRSPATSADEALAALPRLDRYTLISTEDGRTALDRLP